MAAAMVTGPSSTQFNTGSKFVLTQTAPYTSSHIPEPIDNVDMVLTRHCPPWMDPAASAAFTASAYPAPSAYVASLPPAPAQAATIVVPENTPYTAQPVQDAGMGPDHNQTAYMSTRLDGSSIQRGANFVSVACLVLGPTHQSCKSRSRRSTRRRVADDAPATGRDLSRWCNVCKVELSCKYSLKRHYTTPAKATPPPLCVVRRQRIRLVARPMLPRGRRQRRSVGEF